MNWTASHYITIPVAYAVILALAVFSRRWKPSIQLWVLRSLVILLYVGEFIKQILGLTNENGYPLNYLPFHFSSTFYFCFSFYVFGKGRLRQLGACATFVSGFFLFGTMTVNPYAVVGDTYDIFTAYIRCHSYFYHVFVLLFWAMFLAQERYRPARGDLGWFALYLFTWATAAVIAAYSLQINYTGILVSYIPLLEEVRKAAGDAVYLLVYGGLAYGISALFLWLYALLRKRLDARSAAPTPAE